MIRWFKSLFAWETDFEAGIYAYQENRVTGARRARRVVVGGWSPINWGWLTRQADRAPPRAPPSGYMGEPGDRIIGPFVP